MSTSLVVTQSHELLELAGGHTRPVLACKFVKSGTLALSAGLDPHLCIWDLKSGHNHVLGHCHRRSAAITTFDTLDDTRAVTGSSDTRLALVDLHTGRKLRNFAGHTRVVNQVRALNTDRFASVSDDGALKIWDAHTKSPVWQISSEFPLFTLTSSSSSSDDNILYTSGLDPVIRAYDLRQNNGQELFNWSTPHTDSVTSIHINASRNLCSLDFDNCIYISDAKLRPTRDTRDLTSFELPEFSNPDKFLVRSKFTHQDRCLAAQGRLYDVTSQQQLIDFTRQMPSASNVIDMDYDPTANKMLMATESGSLYLYQM